MPKMIRFLSVVSVFVLLSACSREPNQEELNSLYAQRIAQTNTLAEKVTQQKGTIIQVKSFEKTDCNRVPDTKDYLCRANIILNLPFLGDQQNTTEMRVTKGENGWVILD